MLILIAVKIAVTEWLGTMVNVLDPESKGQNC